MEAEAQTKPLTVTVKANNCDLEMEVDSGASLSIIREVTYQSLWAAESKPPLKPTDVKLHTYAKETLQVLGSTEMEVTYTEQSKCLPLLVVGCNRPSLLGKNWLAELKLEWLYSIIRTTYKLFWTVTRQSLTVNSGKQKE